MLFYVLCTAIWLALPDPLMKLVNALFHGLDFRCIQTGEP
ncbi:DUF5676 family membrane protein [Burkholderia contaminans]